MQLVVEHEQKLADYMANPAAFDNLGRLKNATTAEIRQMIIDGRILKLHNEIIGFKDQIHQLLGD